MKHQLAQINVARMIGVNIDDPIMKEFVDNLDRVNAKAEESPGFVWRLKDETNNASSFDPYNDPQIIINISVWEDQAALEEFTYKTFHSDFVRRRKEWFASFGQAHYALWWIKAGEYPSIDQAIQRLERLQEKGPSNEAFRFQDRFPTPR